MLEFYTQDTVAWFKDPKEGFVPGTMKLKRMEGDK
jgi:hypothetical protein